MSSSKSSDLAVLAEVLGRERRRFETFKAIHEAILRIGNLVDAENEARMALESAQADLAWARAELDAAHADMAIIRGRHAEEIRRLETETAQKRANLDVVIARLDKVQIATGIIREALAITVAD